MLLRFRHVLDPLERGSAVVWHPRMPIGRPMSIVWTHGLRGGSSTDGLPVVVRRLVGSQEFPMSGPRTAAAEDGLGLGRCVYFYVGRCEPDFSYCVIAYRASVDCPGQISPFDTGGLFYDWMISGLDLEEKRQLIADHTYDAAGYRDEFRRWILDSFDSVAVYIKGELPPRIGLVPGFVGARAKDWTWEARIPRDGLPAAGLHAVTAFMSEADANDLQAWFVRAAGLSSEERRRLAGVVAGVHAWDEHVDKGVDRRMAYMRTGW